MTTTLVLHTSNIMHRDLVRAYSGFKWVIHPTRNFVEHVSSTPTRLGALFVLDDHQPDKIWSVRYKAEAHYVDPGFRDSTLLVLRRVDTSPDQMPKEREAWPPHVLHLRLPERCVQSNGGRVFPKALCKSPTSPSQFIALSWMAIQNVFCVHDSST